MRRGRTFILLALILLIGAVGAFLLLNRGGGPADEAPTPTPVGEANIVIAAQNISRGSIIAADAAIISPYPADYKVETMLDDLGQVVGKRARMDIARGVPITENMVTSQAGDLLGVGSDASIAIPPGMTAISIPMDRFSGVAFALRSGDQVDVLVSMLLVDIDEDFQTELPNETAYLFNAQGDLLSGFVCRAAETNDAGDILCAVAEERPPVQGKIVETDDERFFVVPIGTQRPRLVSQRLISNALVLGVGTFPLPQEEAVPVAATPVAGVGAPAGQTTEVVEAPAIVPPDIVTLIVRPQDALALNWAVRAGVDLALTLRSPNDPTAELILESMTLQFLIDNYDITVPSKLPFGTVPRLEAPPFLFPPQLEPTPAPQQ
ncbi:MAG: SAF domain-containing protein [Anaerolineales bacterium]